MTLNQLNSIIVKSKNGNLFLQTTFYVPRIDYRNAGFKINKSKKTGITNVEVYIRKDESLPPIEDLVCINPIVHWIDLGDGYKVSKKGKINSIINTTMYELSSSSSRSDDEDKKKKIAATSSDTSSSGGEKP